MHLPWTQVANEVLDHAAPELAVALPWHDDQEISEALALRGLVKLFRWARERCPNDRPPSASAVLSGPAATRLIARTMGWTGDPDALVAAMERVQPSPIVSTTPEGIRINGLDRYDGAWRKNYPAAAQAWDRAEAAAQAVAVGSTREPGVNRAGTGGKPGGNRAVSDRQTQTQTQIEKQTPSRACAEPPHADRPAQAQEQQALLPGPPLLERMDALHRATRDGRALEWGPARWRMDREREISVRADQVGEAEMLRRERNALTYPRGQFPYFGVAGDLDKHWEHYEQPWDPAAGTARRGSDPHQGVMRAEAAPLPTAATHGAVWAAALEQLRESKPYIASQLARLREVAASATSIQLEAPDGYVLAWAESEVRALMERMLAPRAVVLRAAPGSAGPAPPPRTLEEQEQAEDERHAVTAEVLQLVRGGAGGP